ncbi:nitronate monooxygenase [Pelagibacterium lacus]|uniref:Nitronate monooxygenase n=2 Tax=Pelagibacterium lacus TaxID=2282655 RepID=A0A369W4F2_9HYPH|nr:nitronate monooxygenase [Pelagibacterium lacus]
MRLPIVCAPMFLVSGYELVIAQCTAGMVGAFPSLNARPESELEVWLERIREGLAEHDGKNPGAPAAPFAVNLIANKSNSRFDHDARVCVDAKVPLLLTSLHPPGDLVKEVHGYGGLVYHDVTTVRHAEKAIEQGVDGLVLVCAGAGGHAGTASPFAFLSEVRSFYDGTIVLAGAISTGAGLHAALSLGADFVYMGSRFIAARESNAPADYKQMVIDARLKDIVYTPYFSGLPANYLAQSIVGSGLDLDTVRSADPDRTRYQAGVKEKPKAWRDIRGSGQGIGLIEREQSVAEIADGLEAEWHEAERATQARAAQRAGWLQGRGAHGRTV